MRCCRRAHTTRQFTSSQRIRDYSATLLPAEQILLLLPMLLVRQEKSHSVCDVQCNVWHLCRCLHLVVSHGACGALWRAEFFQRQRLPVHASWIRIVNRNTNRRCTTKRRIELAGDGDWLREVEFDGGNSHGGCGRCSALGEDRECGFSGLEMENVR